MLRQIKDSQINLGTVALAFFLFLLGDVALSTTRSIGQYFSFDVFVYSFAGTTHWANVLVKHLVPFGIGTLCAYMMLRRAQTGRGRQAATLEPSVAVGLFMGVLIIAWPSLRFPQLLLFQYHYTFLLASVGLFCFSFSLAGVAGVRIGRAMWQQVPDVAEDAGAQGWRATIGPTLISVLTGVVGAILAKLAGA